MDELSKEMRWFCNMTAIGLKLLQCGWRRQWSVGREIMEKDGSGEIRVVLGFEEGVM